MSKTALVTGAGGFIGHHLVKRLKREGYAVRGVDLKYPEFENTPADEFLQGDLRRRDFARQSMSLGLTQFDEVYACAADMGGMGFIAANALECLTNSVRINLETLAAARDIGCGRYLFTSSVCVYRDMKVGEDALTEDEAWPAQPDNDYGLEKLYSERLAINSAERSDVDIRIARLQNTYGPLGTYEGGREKAPAALSRKVAMAKERENIEIWGDGTAVRNFIYIDDTVEALRILVNSDCTEPVNVGTDEYVTVDELARAVLNCSKKEHIGLEHVPGEVGVESRNFSHEKLRSLGWDPKTTLAEGLERTYAWVSEQVAGGSYTD